MRNIYSDFMVYCNGKKPIDDEVNITNENIILLRKVSSNERVWHMLFAVEANDRYLDKRKK